MQDLTPMPSPLCDQLPQAGASGLHFYTLNRAGPASIVWERLGL